MYVTSSGQQKKGSKGRIQVTISEATENPGES